MRCGVILYGPPAAGKDTIDAALRERSADYRHFARIKVGSGRTDGYRLATAEDVERLRVRGEIIWENRRYNATYVVDQPSLVEALDRGVPVLHLGQVEAVDAVVSAVDGARWVVVALWCPENVALERLSQRGSADISERLEAWRETADIGSADLRLDTSLVQPNEAATEIDALVHAG